MSPSRLFIYYNTRLLAGNENDDIGSSITDAIKTLEETGYCDESLCTYKQELYLVKPSPRAYESCVKIKKGFPIGISAYDFKTVLNAGKAIVFGLYTHPSFERHKDGIYYPRKRERVTGSHAVLCIGYDDITESIKIQNSWSTEWGTDGFSWITYDYLESGLCAEAYIISV